MYNCTLLDNVYKNSKVKMRYCCNIHNNEEQEVTVEYLKRIKRNPCKLCTEKLRTEKQICEIKQRLEESDCEFISCDYVNTNSIVYFICNVHKDKGIQETSLEKLRIKYTHNACWHCGVDLRASNRRTDIELIKSICESKDYKLISSEYTNSSSYLQFICNKHPEEVQNATFESLKYHGHNCKKCRYELTSGENSVFWKGGITPEQTRIRTSSEYKHWRTSVYERDNYTCQCCGQHGGNLQVHHINNFSDYPELRLDISNGITLCNSCHNVNIEGSFHNTYGTWNNTKEQLDEYIINKRTKLGLPLPDIIRENVIAK